MKVLKWMMALMAAVVAAVVGIGFLLPDESHLERTATIDRPPATMYALLNGFRRFNEWSPWAELDPKTIYTLDGPPAGPGARFSWASDDPNVGAGSQEILEAVPDRKIRIRLIFSDFDTDNVSTYVLDPEGAGTRLTWSYDSDAKGSLMGRWFGLMLDSMLGPDYDKGLSRLKTLAETLPADDLAGLDVRIADLEPIPIAAVSGHSSTDAGDAARALADAFVRIGKAMKFAGLEEAGRPLEITRKWDPDAHRFEFDAGVPLDSADATLPEGEVRLDKTPGGLTLVARHVGPLAALPKTYERIAIWRKVAGFEAAGDAWEQYVSDPAATAEADRITSVNVPVR